MASESKKERELRSLRPPIPVTVTDDVNKQRYDSLAGKRTIKLVRTFKIAIILVSNKFTGIWRSVKATVQATKRFCHQDKKFCRQLRLSIFD